MIKAALAAIVLTGAVVLIAPFALATGGAETCAATPTEVTPTEVMPTEVMPAEVTTTGATSTGAVPTGAVPTGAVPTGVARPGVQAARVTPTECRAPVDTGGELPGANEAVARALRLVGSHGYYQLCARLAANIWGRPRAGYFSAAEQWRQMVATNNAHRGDRQPPAGALVFWETGGPYGHVAVYVGDGRIVSNDIGDEVPGEGGVYLVDFGLIESKWGSTYLGWAPPIYSTT